MKEIFINYLTTNKIICYNILNNKRKGAVYYESVGVKWQYIRRKRNI